MSPLIMKADRRVYSLIVKECNQYCQKYNYLLNHQDIEDIAAKATINVANYVPHNFESEIHERNWVKLFTARYCQNAFRDFQVKKLKHEVKTYEITWNEDKTSIQEWIAQENFQTFLDKAVAYFKLQKPRDKRILLNYLSPKHKLAKKFNLSRRQIYGIKEKFKHEVLNYSP